MLKKEHTKKILKKGLSDHQKWHTVETSNSYSTKYESNSVYIAAVRNLQNLAFHYRGLNS
jgi:hypothetical protein